jgi:DnaJ-class molecular chaperone
MCKCTKCNGKGFHSIVAYYSLKLKCKTCRGKGRVPNKTTK